MPLDVSTAGGSRGLLADALAQLTKQYAGTAAPAGQKALTEEELRKWLAANPQTFNPLSTLGGTIPTAPPVPGLPGVPAPMGQLTAAGWQEAPRGGVQDWRYNMAVAPGPLGEGPGTWTTDYFGRPMWRGTDPWGQSEWVPTGDPNDPWDIKGET